MSIKKSSMNRRLKSLYIDNFISRFCGKLSYMAYYFTIKIRREIGRNIKRFRNRKELKQVEVAVGAGVNPSYYSKIERGEVNPSLEKVYRIIKSLKIHSSDILPF